MNVDSGSPEFHDENPEVMQTHQSSGRVVGFVLVATLSLMMLFLAMLTLPAAGQSQIHKTRIVPLSFEIEFEDAFFMSSAFHGLSAVTSIGCWQSTHPEIAGSMIKTTP